MVEIWRFIDVIMPLIFLVAILVVGAAKGVSRDAKFIATTIVLVGLLVMFGIEAMLKGGGL